MKKNLFRWLIALAILLPCLVISASAATEGNYTYSVSDGKATITDVDTSISGAVTIPSKLGGYPVTGIGDRSFYFCESLTSVTIPDSVTSIGDSAFYGCSGLTSVTIPDSVTGIGYEAFRNCTGLTSVTIPDSVTSIGGYAFDNCTGLTSVTIPDSVKSIGGNAFGACYGLTRIEVAAGNTAYCDVDGVLFSKDKPQLVQYPAGRSGSYTIPDSVTSIGECAFYGCRSLTSVTIPDSVTSIGDRSFYFCESLTSVTIPDSVTSIGDWAFYYCTGLTSVTIPDSVTSIGSNAFSECYSLASVTIGNSVTSIGDDAFRYCYDLARVDFLCDMPTSVGGEVFASCYNVTLYYHAGTSGWPTDGTWQGRPLVMQPHIETVVPAVAPTCGATGLTEGSVCSMCGDALVEQEIVPALGHDYIDHAAKAPTTESVGWEAYQTCSRCDYTTYKELPKLEEDKPVVSATQFKFSLEVIKTIKVNGQNVDICRWVWTPAN